MTKKQKTNMPVHEITINPDELWPKPVPQAFWDAWLECFKIEPVNPDRYRGTKPLKG